MRRLGTLCALGLFAACMSTSLSTDASQTGAFNEFDLWPGPKVLSITGGDLLPDSAPSTACFPQGPPNGNKFVYTRVNLALENGAWVARSITPADGNITLMLKTVGPAIGEHLVSGTAVGSAVSVLPFTGPPGSPPSKVQIVFDTTGSIDGDGETIGVFVQGHISGTSRFVDTTGAQSTCGRVEWTLQALVPGS